MAGPEVRCWLLPRAALLLMTVSCKSGFGYTPLVQQDVAAAAPGKNLLTALWGNSLRLLSCRHRCALCGSWLGWPALLQVAQHAAVRSHVLCCRRFAIPLQATGRMI